MNEKSIIIVSQDLAVHQRKFLSQAPVKPHTKLAPTKIETKICAVIIFYSFYGFVKTGS